MASIVRATGWDPFTSLVRQFDTDFDGLVRRAFGPQATGRATGFVPAADVRKDGSDVVVTLELPGVDVSSDVDVEVAEGKLVISGQRHAEERTENDGVLVREIRSGSFRREFALPKGVSAESVDAGYADGLLTVRVHDVVRPAVTPAKVTIRQGTASPADTTEPEQPQN